MQSRGTVLLQFPRVGDMVAEGMFTDGTIKTSAQWSLALVCHRMETKGRLQTDTQKELRTQRTGGHARVDLNLARGRAVLEAEVEDGHGRLTAWT